MMTKVEALLQRLQGAKSRVASSHVDPEKGMTSIAPVNIVELERKAHAYYEAGQFKLAVLSLRQAIDLGSILALNALGGCYLYGLGVQKDEKIAVECFRRAANQNIALAQHQLGRCYRDGKGTQKDKAAARQYFELAANQGNADATWDLACLLKKNKKISPQSAFYFREAGKLFRAQAREEKFSQVIEQLLGKHDYALVTLNESNDDERIIEILEKMHDCSQLVPFITLDLNIYQQNRNYIATISRKIEEWEKRLALHQKLSLVYITLATAFFYIQQNLLENALDLLERSFLRQCILSSNAIMQLEIVLSELLLNKDLANFQHRLAPLLGQLVIKCYQLFSNNLNLLKLLFQFFHGVLHEEEKLPSLDFLDRDPVDWTSLFPLIGAIAPLATAESSFHERDTLKNKKIRYFKFLLSQESAHAALNLSSCLEKHHDSRPQSVYYLREAAKLFHKQWKVQEHQWVMRELHARNHQYALATINKSKKGDDEIQALMEISCRQFAPFTADILTYQHNPKYIDTLYWKIVEEWEEQPELSHQLALIHISLKTASFYIQQLHNAPRLSGLLLEKVLYLLEIPLLHHLLSASNEIETLEEVLIQLLDLVFLKFNNSYLRIAPVVCHLVMECYGQFHKHTGLPEKLCKFFDSLLPDERRAQQHLFSEKDLLPRMAVILSLKTHVIAPEANEDDDTMSFASNRYIIWAPKEPQVQAQHYSQGDMIVTNSPYAAALTVIL